MNMLTLNIRGIGVADKLSWLLRIKRENIISFMAIQETQFEELSRIPS